MDATHIHLILAHFPIVGAFIGLFILAYGQFAKNNSIKKVAYTLFIVMAILTVPVFLSGEEAEETVEHIAGISENLIEEHEEFAEKAIWLMGLLAAFSLLSFYALIKKLSFAKTVSIITLLTALITFGAFAYLGNLGGNIRHSEIRTTNSNKVILNKSDDKDEEHRHENEAIVFNNGKKWKVVDHMMAHIQNMEKDVINFNGNSLEDYTLLSNKLNKNIDLLTSNCTMTGQAHDELHKWLLPYLDLTSRFADAKTINEAKIEYQKIKTSFKDLNKFFK